jgi:hypothetical protein
MSSKQDKQPTDLFERIFEEAEKDEAARILSLDAAALDEELRLGGFDPGSVRAKGRALGQELARAAARARRIKLAKIVAVVAVVGAALAVAALLLARGRGAPVIPELPGLLGNHGPNVAGGRPSPQELRLDASKACEEKDWQKCVELLDEAKDMDPEGDRASEVQRLRGRAARGMPTK